MSKIELSIPSCAKTKGSLYDTSDIRNLTQDMLEIELPGNLFIDVGWYPQWNPAGEYMILVFRDTVDNLLERRIRNRDHRAVKKIVGELLMKYLPASRASGGAVRVIDAPVRSATTSSVSTTIPTVPGLNFFPSGATPIPVVRSAPAQFLTDYILLSRGESGNEAA